MMKKMISILLALALLLGCGAALAETAEKTDMGSLEVKGAFTLKCAIPEGYILETQNMSNESIIAMLASEDEAKPSVVISIAFNEEYADVEKMNDLPEEQLKVIEASFSEMDDVKFEYRETGHGTKLLVVTETDGETDFADIYTIYKGFEMEFVMVPGTEPLTEAQIQMLVDFITGIDFVEAAQ